MSSTNGHSQAAVESPGQSAQRVVMFPADFFGRPATRRLMKKWPRAVEWWLEIVLVAREALCRGLLLAGGEPLSAADLEDVSRNPMDADFIQALIDEGWLGRDQHFGKPALIIPRWTDWYRAPSKTKEARAQESQQRRDAAKERKATEGERKSTAADGTQPNLQPSTEPNLQPIHHPQPQPPTEPPPQPDRVPSNLKPTPTNGLVPAGSVLSTPLGGRNGRPRSGGSILEPEQVESLPALVDYADRLCRELDGAGLDKSAIQTLQAEAPRLLMGSLDGGQDYEPADLAASMRYGVDLTRYESRSQSIKKKWAYAWQVARSHVRPAAEARASGGLYRFSPPPEPELLY